MNTLVTVRTAGLGVDGDGGGSFLVKRRGTYSLMVTGLCHLGRPSGRALWNGSVYSGAVHHTILAENAHMHLGRTPEH